MRILKKIGFNDVLFNEILNSSKQNKTDLTKEVNRLCKIGLDVDKNEKELYDLKHELIAAQIKLETTEKNLRDMQSELNENGKKMVRLETELKEYKKERKG